MPTNLTVSPINRPGTVDLPPGAPPLSARISTLPLDNPAAAALQLRAMHAQPEEFAPTFTQLAAADRVRAQAFAVAFTSSLDTGDKINRFFDVVAHASDADRHSIIDANKAAGNGPIVVHAVGLLPAAQGRLLMRDFLMPNNQTDEAAFRDLGRWMSRAGQILREKNVPIPDADTPHDGWFDDFVDWVGDAVGSLVGAVKSAF